MAAVDELEACADDCVAKFAAADDRVGANAGEGQDRDFALRRSDRAWIDAGMGHDAAAFADQERAGMFVFRSAIVFPLGKDVGGKRVDRAIWLGPDRYDQFGDRPRVGLADRAAIDGFDFRRTAGCLRNGWHQRIVMAPRIVTKPEFPMAVEKNAHPLMPSRREFVQAGVGLSAAGLAAMASMNNVLAAEAPSAAKSGKSLIKPGETILFQGDSITDALPQAKRVDAKF